MSPSYQHGYVCGNVIAALKSFTQYTVFSELTLLIEKEYIPDICVYPHRAVDFQAEDIVKMTEMPLTVIEVLSPSQTILDVLDKFPAYFEAGIKTCWLIIPPAQTVTVYTAPNQGQLFKTGDVVDDVLKLQVPLEQIFV